MISPRTDALSGFLGVDGKQHRELRWLERAALCGVKRDEPRTTEFEQNLAGAARATFLAWEGQAVGEGSIPVPPPPPAWPKSCILRVNLLAIKPSITSDS